MIEIPLPQSRLDEAAADFAERWSGIAGPDVGPNDARHVFENFAGATGIPGFQHQRLWQIVVQLIGAEYLGLAPRRPL